MLLTMFGVNLNAQTKPGSLQYAAPQVDNMAGTITIPVNWNGDISTSLKQVSITATISGTSVVIDQAATQNSISGIPGAPTPVVSFGSNSVTVSWNGGNTPFNVNSAGYAGLFSLVFRANPGSSGTTGFAAGSFVVSPVGQFVQMTPRGTANYQAPSPIQISVEAQKYGGTSCSGASNNRISNVNFTFDANESPYPGLDPQGINASTGLATADVARGYSYTLIPSKTSGCQCGVNSADVLRVRQLILGIIGNGTLIDYLAGDYNYSGDLTAYDLTFMNGCILNVPQYSNPVNWRFILPGSLFTTQPPFNPIPTLVNYISTPVLSGNLSGLVFYGIKPGDLDQNCSECNNFRTGDEVEYRSTTSNFAIKIPDFSVKAGQEYVVSVQADQAGNLGNFDLQLFFDRSGLEVLGTEGGDLSAQFQMANIEEETALRSKVQSAWFTMERAGERIEAGGTLLRVRVKAKKDAECIRSMVWQGDDPDRNLLGLSDSEQMTRLVLSSLKAASHGFEVSIVGANVVHDQINLMFETEQAVSADLRVFDAAGRTLDRRTVDLTGGRQMTALRDLSLVPGAYLLSVQSALGRQTLRFIKY
jgi:hypothetical protein